MAKDIINNNGIFDIGFTAKNTAFGFALTIAALFIASWIAVITTLSDAMVSLIVGFITNLCIAFCGFRAARHSGVHGLLSGAISGLVYVILLYFAGSIAFGELGFSYSAALSVIICVLSGAIGGIIGINTRHKRRR